MGWIQVQFVVLFMCCIKLQIRPASSVCPYQYTFMESSCFRFVSNVRTSWQDAQQICANEDSHLAVLDTTPRRDMIVSYMKANHIPLGTSYWVDGRDPQQNGKWIWYSKGTGVDSVLWHPVNGAWGAWRSWSGCSLTCGTQGLRYRSRQCDNLAPLGDGKYCPGSGRETEVCFPGPCPACQVHAVPGAMSSVSAPRINEKEYVRYYCLPDYTYVSGNLIRTCQANGALSGTEPECKACCGKTKAIPNGEPKNSDKYVCEGKGVGYDCHVGYRISNMSVPAAVCDSQKLKVPVCEPSGTCDTTALRDPKHGFKVCEDINSGKTCHMRCEDGYKYVARDKTFYCNPETGWSWGLPQYGGGFLPSTSVEDCEVGHLLGVDGGLDGLIADVPFYDYLEEDQIKTEVADGVRAKLNTLGKCSKSCEVKDVQVKRAGTVKRDTMVSFNIRIVLHIRGGDRNASSLSEVKANVLRLAKSIQSTASAIKQVLQSTPIVISVNGQYIDLQTDNLVISRPRTGCRMGSIKSGIKCYRCPRGTYHDTNDGDCLSCPFGHNQDNPGQVSCLRCPKGKTTDRIGVSNATECKEYFSCDCGIHPCVLNGSTFTCKCLSGYILKNGTCKDIDECATKNPCPTNSRCVNREGSFRCQCLPGFQGRNCEDIDECLKTCNGLHQICVNTVGSFRCNCTVGYFGDSCDDLCPNGFIPVSDSWCVHIFNTSNPQDERLNYENSTSACAALYRQARLVTIKTKTEYKHLTKLLASSNIEHWIGLNDRAQEGHFVASDGSMLGSGDFTEWAPGRPSTNTSTNCVVMGGKSDAYMWRDAGCYEAKSFLCEFRRKSGLSPIIG
ncbi:signal peptide, CUB and EGF-like domain-containing protein 2 isoform X2 [Lingula anatina]|uniref:Signal peptide, CUB and EGF-like domain-containing protein 2 isoform X2 n=1 Tax=Lingula anatina TaxID=7574 RepID=A0A1S3JIM8_LINAN|nr:signal peptide, CUB and EGF-like domain-containing protein 2 isoform X2 [Lingula anatina]|eukprot:XP_013410228.1 signal peptide, CUB and EGF-like domain-containing protein 2 isoform X2 [Lingula anatina]